MDQQRFKIGVLTLSDKGSRGERVDESGRLIGELVAPLGGVSRYQVIADEEDQIRMVLTNWADDLKLDLVLTTGGTGLSPRDQTPQATAAILDYEVPGIAEEMRRQSYAKTPRAMLSRGLAGVRRQTLIINLPGSPKAVAENLEVVLPVLTHALEKLQGDPSDCARTDG